MPIAGSARGANGGDWRACRRAVGPIVDAARSIVSALGERRAALVDEDTGLAMRVHGMAAGVEGGRGERGAQKAGVRALDANGGLAELRAGMPPAR